MTNAPTPDAVIWLERLANRCRGHGYAQEAQRLRQRAKELNAHLPEGRRVSPDDERCYAPVETETTAEFIRLARESIEQS